MTDETRTELTYEAPTLEAIGPVQEVFLGSPGWGRDFDVASGFVD